MTTTQMELLQSLSEKAMTQNLRHAAKRLQEGKVVLLLDDRERENEGDLIVAAEKITPETMNFLIKQGSGVVCVALPKTRLDGLGLPLMITDNTNFFQTAFTVSIEAKQGVTTGVSAKDRAHTIQVLMADDADGSDLARPGHVFPLAAKKNGVFDRMGHTEGSVDLMRLAGLKPGAVLCELMDDDGSMTMGENRVRFAKKFDIPVVSVEEILCHRIRTENIFEKTSQLKIKTRFANMSWHSFRFLNAITVDIFHPAEWNTSAQKNARISLLHSDQMPYRFVTQVLQHSDDDPLCVALNSMKNGVVDFVVTATVNDKTVINLGEKKAAIHAIICRSLHELLINDIAVDSTHADLARIASDYFGFNITLI